MDRLDEEIVKVQRSTRTLFGFMEPVHNYFRMRFGWYYKWHTTPWSRPVHWSVLAVYFVTLCLGILWGYNPNFLHFQGKAMVHMPTYDYPRWEWENPKPSAFNLSSSYASDDKNIWAGGGVGNILHYNGTVWTQQYAGTNTAAESISGGSASNIWATSGSSLLHYDGVTWSILSAPVPSVGISEVNLQISASSDGSVWLKSSYKHLNDLGHTEKVTEIYCYNGSSWDKKYTHQDESLLDNLSIYVLDANNIWFFGAKAEAGSATNVVMKNSGANWIEQYSSSSLDITSLKAISGTEILMTAHRLDQGTHYYSILKYNGTNWDQLYDGSLVFRAMATFGINIWVLASTGEIYKYSGGSGAIQSINTSTTVTNFVVLSATEAWAFSEDNTNIFKYNGTSWANQSTSFASANLNDLVMFNEDNIWIAGANGTIRQYNGLSWSSKYSGSGTELFTHITATATNNIWASYANKILSYNGSSWTTSYTGYPVADLMAKGSGNIWAVVTGEYEGPEGPADQARVLKYNTGTSAWDVMYTLNDFKAVALYVQDATHVWFSASQETAGEPVTIDNKIIYYNGSTWTTQFETTDGERQVNSMMMFDANTGWAGDSLGGVRQYSSGAWSSSVTSLTSTSQITNLYGLDTTHIWAVGKKGFIGFYNGSTWSDQQSIGSTQQFNAVAAYATSGRINAWAVGNNGIAYHYYAPQNTMAEKILVALPGQSFADGVGIIGTPIPQKVGTPFTATVYAVDLDNKLDRGNASIVGFNTSDPNDTDPASLQLTNDQQCSQSEPNVNYPCGIGHVSVTFHTVGSWTLTVQDLSHFLESDTSSSISVIAGDPAKLSINAPSGNLIAGSPFGPITVQLQDLYENNVVSTNNRAISLTSNSTQGNFGDSSNSFDDHSTTILAGNGTASFYYLDYNTGNPTITVSANGLSDATVILNVIPGSISPLENQSNISINSTAPVSDKANISFTVILKDFNGNFVSDKEITILSSRGDRDTISFSGKTNDQGKLNGTLFSRVAGTSVYTVIDKTDNIYLEQRPSVRFIALSPDKISIENLFSEKVIAGAAMILNVRWFDKFNNNASINSGNLKITSSDSQMILAKAQETSLTRFFLNLSHTQASPTLSKSYSPSDNGGLQIKVTFYTAGAQTITIADSNNNLQGALNILVIPAAFSSSKSVFEINSDTIGIGSTTTATVTILDTFGNPLSGKSVEVKPEAINNNLIVDPSIGTSDDQGKVKFKLSGKTTFETNLIANDLTDGEQLAKTIHFKVVPATLVQKVLDSLRESIIAQKIAEIAKPIAQIGAGFASASIFVQIAAAIPQGFHVAVYGSNFVLQALGIRRRRRQWGTVLDSLTGQPVSMAIIRLFESTTNKLVATEVSDTDGRFEFTVAAGSYRITVTKENYQFPATFFPKTTIKSSALPYSGRYLGQVFTVSQDNPLISLTIPIDPINPAWSFTMRLKAGLIRAYSYFEIAVSITAIPFLFVGAILALFGYVVKPDSRSAIVLTIYAVLAILTFVRKYIKTNRQFMVYDADTGKPLARAVIAIFDTEFKMLRANLLTNEKGLGSILLPKGTYEIKIDYQGYQFTNNPKIKNKFASLLKNPEIKIENSRFIHFSIAMQKKNDNVK